MLSKTQWATLIRDYFECPTHEELYILGCFSRHVTLYSQQVRAFNLIYGLHEIKKIKRGSKVAVIGAGAAGLSAAAAARHLGCKVTLLEELDGPLELQHNNRQRWIHPRIYDWPATGSLQERAGLPIFNWTADYADKVATQIEGKWREFLKSKPVDEFYAVANLQILREGCTPTRYTVNFFGEPGGQNTLYVDHLILAIGFGLEPRTYFGDSYWAEDDYDSSFRKRGQRWLVSGVGDGALTDLMRLCIKGFRHDEILKLISTDQGMVPLLEDLHEINANMKLSDAEVSAQFKEQFKNKKLQVDLKDWKKKRVPEIVWAGPTSAMYGRKSSILNRVIVALLSELEAFRYEVGRTEIVEQKGNKTHVRIGSSKKIQRFDRVILRHGPDDSISVFMKKTFPGHRIKKLRDSWKDLATANDVSRRPQWKVGRFGEENLVEIIPIGADDIRFKEEVLRYGVRIAALTVSKDINEEGGSRIIYSVEGLTVTDPDKVVSGIHVHYESPAGNIMTPDLGEFEERYGLKWVPDDLPELDSGPIESAIRKARLLSGTVHFKHPLTERSTPLSFVLQANIVNGDALTRWEFEHIYRREDMVHVDAEELTCPQDYFSRLVWCPIDKLTLKVTLPPGSDLEAPTGSMFRLEKPLASTEVMNGSTLFLDPTRGSPLLPPSSEWKRENDPGILSSLRFSATAPTWELSVLKPPVGTGYSLDWTLPDGRSDSRFERLAEDSGHIRRELIAYRNRINERTKLTAIDRQIGNLLMELHSEFRERQHQLVDDEPFETGFMTFNDVSHRLEHISGTGADGRVMDPINNFWLPIGLGLGGAAYKMGDRAYVYYGEEEAQRTGGPRYYLPLSGQVKHTSMIAFPIDNPGWDTSFAAGKYERSRQCIGVIDVNVTGNSPWFEKIKALERTEIQELFKVVIRFAEKIATALKVS